MGNHFCCKCPAFTGAIFLDQTDLKTYCELHKTEAAIPYTGDAATLNGILAKNNSKFVTNQFNRKRNKVTSVRLSDYELLYMIKQMEIFNIKSESAMIRHLLQTQPAPRNLTLVELEEVAVTSEAYKKLEKRIVELEKQLNDLEEVAVGFVKDNEFPVLVKVEVPNTYCPKCGKKEKRKGYCLHCLAADSYMML